VVAVRPKGLLQVIIGPGQIRDLIAVKEPWPVAARDFQEMSQRGGKCPSASPMPRHGAQQATQATLNSRPRALVLVGEDLGYLVAPAIGDAHLGPQQGGLGQAPLEERLKPEQGLGEAPLFATRSRLVEMALRRACSLSPEAASGG
jgi:hypothetical protein